MAVMIPEFFREVTEVGKVLEQIQETVGSVTKSPVAVLYDRENDWALKDAQGPRNEDMHYQENVQKQYRALRRKVIIPILSVWNMTCLIISW